MPLPPDRWARLEALFTSVSEMEPAARQAALAQAHADDPQLGALLERMLRASDSAPRRIADAIGQAAGAFVVPEQWAGRRFGPYEIVREIGRGGMGLVFEAVRADGEFRQRVALKIAPDWRGDAGLLDRFRAERRILAELESDTIARFFDGGAEDGIPYFAMELVDGEPITRYCDRAGLSIAQRLRLFLQVCRAVEFAHSRLVVHRDLKPANILVTPQGVPKLVDFGVAKVLDPSLDPGLTVVATPAWTPDYVSPEQVRGRPVTVCTDVYALGLVLYELVCGERGQHGDTTSALALDRSVCETEPERPSRVLLKRGERSRAREVAGDLETVILKAARKDPGDRYASVAAFAADIDRLLEHRPIQARQFTRWQRGVKFVRRHRTGAAAGLVMVLIAAVGVASTVRQARRAERRFQQVRSLANTFVFDVHDRIAPLPGATEARHVIVKTALTYLESLRSDAGDDPALARELASAYERIGSVQGLTTVANLGDTAGALQSFEHGSAILAPLVAAGDDEARYQYASIAAKTAAVHRARGDVRRADEAFDRAQAAGRDLLARFPRDPRFIELVGSVDGDRSRARFELRDYAGAERDGREAMELAARLAAQDPSNRGHRDGLASAHNALGAVQIGAGNLVDAAAQFRESVAIRERLVAENPDSADYRRALAVSYGSLGDVLGYRPGENLGDPAGAVEVYRKAADLAADARRRDPKDRRALYDLANVHLRIGTVWIESNPPRFDEARRELDVADEATRTLLAQDSGVAAYRYLAMVIDRRMGEALDGAGRQSEALARLQQSRALGAALAGTPNAPSVRLVAVHVIARLGLIRAKGGPLDAALADAEEASRLLKQAPLGSPIVDATVHRLLGLTYQTAAGRVPNRGIELVPKAREHFEASAALWRDARLSPALEPGRATALAALSTSLSALPR